MHRSSRAPALETARTIETTYITSAMDIVFITVSYFVCLFVC